MSERAIICEECRAATIRAAEIADGVYTAHVSKALHRAADPYRLPRRRLRQIRARAQRAADRAFRDELGTLSAVSR